MILFSIRLPSLALLIMSELYLFMSIAEAIIGSKIQPAGNKFPFVVLIAKPTSDGEGLHHICTGSLIAKNRVLTAASWLNNEDIPSLRVYAQSTNSSFRQISSKLTYAISKNVESKSDETFEIDDMSILGLAGETFDIEPANWKGDGNLDAGAKITIVGWGMSGSPTSGSHEKSPSIPYYAGLKKLANGECLATAQFLSPEYREALKEGKIFCVQNGFHGSASAYDADFGGPALDADGKIIGILLRPKFPGPSEIKFGQPNLVLRLTNHTDFLRNNIP